MAHAQNYSCHAIFSSIQAKYQSQTQSDRIKFETVFFLYFSFREKIIFNAQINAYQK